jgi:hypothetical protein
MAYLDLFVPSFFDEGLIIFWGWGGRKNINKALELVVKESN